MTTTTTFFNPSAGRRATRSPGSLAGYLIAAAAALWAIPALCFLAMTAHAAAPAPRVQSPKLPYTFEQNQGQAPEAVRFLARGDGYALYLTDRDAVLGLKGYSVRMSLPGGRKPQAIEPLEAAEQHTNYFIGDHPSQWHTDVPHFSRVRYRGVYEGVDLVYHSSEDSLEYDFVVAAGAAAEQIEILFDGPDRVRVNREGALELASRSGVLLHRAPVAYQDFGGQRHIVTAAYEVRANGRIGFRLGEYDRNQPLVIDPIVIYSSYLGGDRSDQVNAVAADAQGNTYITGETTSTNFPVVGTNLTPGSAAVVYSFVTKLAADGKTIVYSTYLGGSSNTRGYAIQVDAQGSVVTGGVTGARNFPLVNPVQTTQPVLNIGYVAKLNPQGNAIQFSTYIGGERNDEVNGVAIDIAGSIHITGRTTSSTFPTVNAIQSTFGGNTDIFIAKYAAPNYRLAYSTYLGKDGLEFARAIAVDVGGNVYITGTNFGGAAITTTGAYQTKATGRYEVMVAKIAAPGNRVDWLTYIGGRDDDEGRAIAIDGDGNVWVGGSTYSNNFPVTPGAFQPDFRGDTDAFFAELNPFGTQLKYSSLLGSTARTGVLESVQGIAVDVDHLYLAGVTEGGDFPSVRPLQSFGGGSSDAFLAVFLHRENRFEFSTPIGGSANDTAYGLAVDPNGFMHLGGYTLSANFPLKNALRQTVGGSDEGFISKICDPHLRVPAPRVMFVHRIGAPLPNEQKLAVTACTAIPYTVTAQGAFVRVKPASGMTNGEVTVDTDPAGLAVGEYDGSITFTAPDAVNNPLVVPVKLIIAPPPPEVSANAIVNAASGQGAAVAPGEIVVLYGKNLGPQQLYRAVLDANGRVASVLENTKVFFDGVPAPMVYTFAAQVSAVVPYSVAGRAQTQVEVEYLGFRSTAVTLPVTQTVPGIFTLNGSGVGLGAILHPDYSVNGPSNPAEQGSTVILFVTGEGQTDPGGVDGRLASEVLPKPVLPVEVSIGGVRATVDYAGAAPGLVSGVMQVNVRIPAGTPSGVAEVIVKVGNTASRGGVTVAVK